MQNLLIQSCMQNENSQRASTSERLYLDMRRPDRRTPMKVLTEKSFRFVDQMWDCYMAKNMEDLRYANVIMPKEYHLIFDFCF